MRIQSILVICTGNICRSPMGERILQRHIQAIAVSSAGTHGLSGQPAEPQAIAVAAAHGVSLDNHVARMLTTAMLKQHDLILAMEQAHINHISQIAPEIRGKTLLFGQWLEKQEIPDPYGQHGEAFEYVFRLLDAASREWAKRLKVKELRTCRRTH